MFTCKKCKEPFHALGAEIRGQTLRVYCQCLNGHKGKRDVSQYQADSMAHDIFSGLFTCVGCGLVSSLINMDLGRREVEYTFLCPIHGEQKKRIPAHYHTAITGLQNGMNSSKSILDSMFCPRCNQIFSAKDIIDRKRYLEVRYKCPNGHKELRFIPKDADESILKSVIKRLIHCDECGLPCQVIKTSEKGDRAQVEVNCPAHGKLKKELPSEFAWLVAKISDAMSEGTIVRSMMICRDCSEPLSIRAIELDKSKYKLKCTCPKGHSTEMNQPTDLDEEAIDALVGGLLKCNDCALLTEIVEVKHKGKITEIELVCPRHGTMRKGLAAEVFKHLEEKESLVDRMPSVAESLKCEKCSAPFIIRDTKPKEAVIELRVECRNGHGTDLFFSNTARESVLTKAYQQLYECHKCHGKLDLVRIDELDGKSEIILNCLNHGSSKRSLPTGHEAFARDAFIATKKFEDLQNLLDTSLQTQRACEYQIAPEMDIDEMLDILRNIIEQQSVTFVDERDDERTGLEIWYYGKALVGDEFVVTGSVSPEGLAVRISVASNDEEKLNMLLSDMRDELRDVLLKIQSKSDDTGPSKIECCHCGAALRKRALPGETVLCEHCGTPLHWG